MPADPGLSEWWSEGAGERETMSADYADDADV